MKHFASKAFWSCYDNLPTSIKNLADKNFDLLKKNPKHPSLHFKKIGNFRSVRIGLRYRSLGVEVSEGILILVPMLCVGMHRDEMLNWISMG